MSGGVDDLLVAEVEHHDAVVDGRAAQDLSDRGLAVLAIERDALGDVRRGAAMKLEAALGRRTENRLDPAPGWR